MKNGKNTKIYFIVLALSFCDNSNLNFMNERNFAMNL